MKTSNYVIINNRAYDPITGLPVDGVVAEPAEVSAPKVERSEKIRGVANPAVHSSHMQRSTTLNRRHVKRPAIANAAAPVVASVKETASPAQAPAPQKAAEARPIQKFAPVAKSVSTPVRADRPAETHPITRRATARTLDISAPRRQRAAISQKLDTQSKLTAVPKPVEQKQLKSAHVLKNEAIFEAMNREVSDKKQRRSKTKRSSGRWTRFLSLGTASLAVLLLAGYFTYLNMPNLSTKMAAIQSGVNAKYPGYRPDGYALNGPITFKDGEVKMKFAYASGQQDFIINQQRSSWDSSAVKQFVDTKSPDVTTTTVDGLTIYTYDGNAAWVNSGVLYTLEGNAPLSSDQIQRIATSM